MRKSGPSPKGSGAKRPAANAAPPRRARGLAGGHGSQFSISRNLLAFEALKASAWSYPGEYTLQLNTVAGQTYDLDVAPREASIGPAVLFGAIGGLIDSSTNENAGLFELKQAGGKGA